MYTLGLDFGTNSVRALVVRVTDGREMGSAVRDYPSGHQGILTDPADPHLARQHPGDYVWALEHVMLGALAAAEKEAGFSRRDIIGIGVDTTASSPIPVDARNVPLALTPQFAKNLNAQCWLWKDHTSWREAQRITELAAQYRPHFLARCGGAYSSEWFWSKIAHCLAVDPVVFSAAHSWVEFADWIPSLLAGIADPAQVTRGVCMAGHKAMYASDWGGLPDAEFLALISPELAKLRDRLFTRAVDANAMAGRLSAAWAQRLGLREGIPLGIGGIDVHYGAVGSGVAEGTLVKVIGTSTCDCGVLPARGAMPEIPGICGIVDGSILPGNFGIEAGQSAVGDIFKWWVETICSDSSHEILTRDASALRPGASGLLALDWHNGNRNVLADQRLSGLILGMSLHTTRAEIYRTLIEATAFGARVIIERLKHHGVPVQRVVCAGGIALKSPLTMQIYADVLGCEIEVAGSSQACALGSAIVAAVVAGAHPDFPTAQRAMVPPTLRRFTPDADARRTYDQLHALYREVHDAFGGVNRSADLSRVMKDLLTLRETAATRNRQAARS